MASEKFSFASPPEAAAAFAGAVSPVATETIDWREAAGRILARPLLADRPSPPIDVSAVDGYAIRLHDCIPGEVRVAAEAAIGHPPIELPAGAAVRVFTGAPLPAGAELVLMREWLEEYPDSDGETRGGRIVLPAVLPGLALDLHARRMGENLAADELVLPAGAQIGPAAAGAIAGFGMARPEVFKKVRVAILATGDELRGVEEAVEPWQIRDSNSHALAAMFGQLPWIELVTRVSVDDRPEAIARAFREALEAADAVVLSGGVSMGDHDHVPNIIRDSGAQVLFHKLPMRPGKPILAAVGPGGQAVLGLPGNPVSVLVTARRIALPALRKRAGFADPDPVTATVTMDEPFGAPLNLWWFRPVKLTAPGRAIYIPNRGSGDYAAAARADGFVQCPPGEQGNGPFPFHSWNA